MDARLTEFSRLKKKAKLIKEGNDVKELKKSSKLNRELEIKNNRVGTISMSLLKVLRAVKVVDFSSEEILFEDVTFLSQCHNVKDLNLSNNSLSIFTSTLLYDRDKLKSLVIENNTLQECNVYALKNLYSLCLSNNALHRVMNLQDLEGLVYLDLSFNFLESFSGFVKLQNLRVLDLSMNGIEMDITRFNSTILCVLQALKKLEYIAFFGNPITEIIPHFKHYIIFNVPSLEYYDYFEISKNIKKEAKTYGEYDTWKVKQRTIKSKRRASDSRVSGIVGVSSPKKNGNTSKRKKELQKLGINFAKPSEKGKAPPRGSKTTREKKQVRRMDIKINSSRSSRHKSDKRPRSKRIESSDDNKITPTILPNEGGKFKRSQTSRINSTYLTEDLDEMLSAQPKRPKLISRSFNSKRNSIKPNSYSRVDSVLIILDEMENLMSTNPNKDNGTVRKKVSDFIDIDIGKSTKKNIELQMDQKPSIEKNTISDSNIRVLTSPKKLENESTIKNSKIDIDVVIEMPQPGRDILLQHPIGQGIFGLSYLGLYEGSNIRAKKIYCERNEKNEQKLALETSIMQDRAKNINGVVQILFLQDFEFIVQPYITGKNFSEYFLTEKLNDLAKLSIMRNLCNILLDMHDKGIIHGALKPSNIIIEDDKKVWINDYGYLWIKENIPMEYDNYIEYCDPEFFEIRFRDFKFDIYAFGMLLYFAFTGKKPYHNVDPNKIREAALKSKPIIPPNFPIGLKQVIQMCWAESVARPNMDVIKYYLNAPNVLEHTVLGVQNPNLNKYDISPLPYLLNEDEFQKIQALCDVILLKILCDDHTQMLRGFSSLKRLCKNVKIATYLSQKSDILDNMVNLLNRTTEPTILSEVLRGMAQFVKFDILQSALVDADIVTHLVDLLYIRDDEGLCLVLKILKALAVVDSIKEKISLVGGTFPLMNLLRYESSKVQMLAVKALGTTLYNRTNLENFRIAGGFQILIEIGKSTSFDTIIVPLCNNILDLEGREVLETVKMKNVILKNMDCVDLRLRESVLLCLEKYSDQKDSLLSRDEYELIIHTLIQFLGNVDSRSGKEFIHLAVISTRILNNISGNTNYLMSLNSVNIVEVTLRLMSFETAEIVCNSLKIILNCLSSKSLRTYDIKSDFVKNGIMGDLIELLFNLDPQVREHSTYLLSALINELSTDILHKRLIPHFNSIIYFSTIPKEVNFVLDFILELSKNGSMVPYLLEMNDTLMNLLEVKENLVEVILNIIWNLLIDEKSHHSLSLPTTFPYFLNFIDHTNSRIQIRVLSIIIRIASHLTSFELLNDSNTITRISTLLISQNKSIIIAALKTLVALSVIKDLVSDISNHTEPLMTRLITHSDAEIRSLALMLFQAL